MILCGADCKRFRTTWGLTQSQLARLTGYSVEYISRVECKKLKPSVQFAEEVYKASRALYLAKRYLEQLKAAEEQLEMESYILP